MIDPDATAQDPAAPSAPAAASPPVTGQEAVTTQAPGANAPRRRRRWGLAALAAVVVLGLAAGLVVWAPWIPPPVLRPAGLKAGPATATSVTLRWSRPPTGPLPDKYLIWSSGTMTGSAAGTATSYRQRGLTPASTYYYRVVAVRDGKHSPASAVLTLSTFTPPVSQARLQDAWHITARNTYIKNFTVKHGRKLFWTFTPACATGPCDVTLKGQIDNVRYVSIKLTRRGAVYQGQAVDHSVPCGSGATSIPDPLTLKVRIHVTAAAAEGQAWVAGSWRGTLTATSPYVSSATFYCAAGTITTTLKATAGLAIPG